MKKSILTLINNNLKKCLIILILISVLNVAASILALRYSSAVCISSFLSFMIAIYPQIFTISFYSPIPLNEIAKTKVLFAIIFTKLRLNIYSTICIC